MLRLWCKLFGHSERVYHRFQKDGHYHIFCWRCSGDLGVLPDEYPSFIKQ